MKSYLELITVPSQDNPSTLILLHFDERRYMFGHVAEGTQRLMTENVIRINRISNIFLSGGTEWRTNGGLTGLLLTMGDVKASKQTNLQNTGPKDRSKYMLFNPDGSSVNPYPPPAEPDTLTVHGGKNILHSIATARNFVFRENSGVRFDEYDFVNGDTTYKDALVTVTPTRAFPRLDGEQNGNGEEKRLQEIEDMDLGSRPQLEALVDTMWNGQPGQLQVGKDDEDYVISLLSRLKEDEERERQEKKNTVAQQQDPGMVDESGESPPKRLKLSSGQPQTNSDVNWDGILDENSETPQKTLEFSASRPLRRPWPATVTRSLPGTIPSTASISYMIGIAQVRGKFFTDKARELGVEPGPSFRTLAEGGSVTLKDGTVVYGHQCLGPPRLIDGVAFLDIPEKAFLEPTIENIIKWKQERRANDEHDAIGIWVWAIGPDMEKNERLLGFIDTLEGKHMLNSTTSRFDDVSLRGSSAQLARLNLLSSENFNLPCPDFDHNSRNSEAAPEANDKFIRARDSLILDIHPKPDILTHKCHPRFDYSIVQEEARTQFGDGKYWETVKLAQTQIKEEESIRNFASQSDEVELIALGTGSSSPSKYRNVSSTVVTIPQVGHMLLDCGECTHNQLLRTYGSSGLRDFLGNLKILYISHLHADHHLGSVSVIKAWYHAVIKGGQTAPKLYIVAPHKYLNVLEEYSQIEDFGLRHITYIPCETIAIDGQRPDETTVADVLQRVEDMKSTLGLEEIKTSYAVHCRSAFTVAFTFGGPTHFKVAYSGDTRPTTGFVKIGKDCTVLVHEATFDDELMGEAVAKKHCTTSEAIQAGKDMSAKNLLLTHFSQRYPKLPSIRQQGSREAGERPICDPFMEAPAGKDAGFLTRSGEITIEHQQASKPIVSKPTGAGFMNIGFAFDLMRVKVKDFWKLERFIPALEELFREEEKLDIDGDLGAPTPSGKKHSGGKQKQGPPKQKQGKQGHEKRKSWGESRPNESKRGNQKRRNQDQAG